MILGESTDIVFGVGHIDIALVAALNVALLATWELVVEKWCRYNFKVEVEVDHLENDFRQTIVTALHNKVNGTEAKVQAKVQHVFAQRLKAIMSEANQAGQKVEVASNKVRANTNSILTLGQRIQTVNNKLRTVGTELQNTGTALDTVGQEIENIGTSITQEETDIETALEMIQTAGTVIQQAPLIING